MGGSIFAAIPLSFAIIRACLLRTRCDSAMTALADACSRRDFSIIVSSANPFTLPEVFRAGTGVLTPTAKRWAAFLLG